MYITGKLLKKFNIFMFITAGTLRLSDLDRLFKTTIAEAQLECKPQIRSDIKKVQDNTNLINKHS